MDSGSDMTTHPEIRPGTRLYLSDRDWYHPPTVPGYVDLVVDHVDAECAHTTTESIWVVGHGLYCAAIAGGTPSHPPCIKLRVRVEAIGRAMAAGPQP